MKRLILVTLLLVVAFGSWGYVIVSYASTPHKALAVALTPSPTATPRIIRDIQATIIPAVRESVVFQGSDTLKEIALTFDDGPSEAYTAQVLAILQQYNVKATFFCIGEQVQTYRTLVQQEYQTGHNVGNHTWNHSDLTTLDTQAIQYQLDTTSSAIQQATGVMPTLFRPPYGAINAEVKNQAAQRHMMPILWNIDTEDWQMPGTPAIVKTALNNAVNGSIILMHDGGGNRSQTVAALPQIITGLQARGFKLVTVSQLMTDSNM